MNDQFDFVNCFEQSQNDAVNYALASVAKKVSDLRADLTTTGTESDGAQINPDSLIGEIIAVLTPVIRQEAVNSAYPVGSTYVQYPDTSGNFDDAKSPSVLYPGTSWILLFNSESVFFRTEGSAALESRSQGVQLDALKSHLHKHQHNHGMANHTHSASTIKVTLPSSGRTATTPYNDSYAGSSTAVGTGGYKPTVTASGSTGGPSTNATNDNTAQPNTDSTGGSETRPKNRLMRIWERTQ